jgi:hypothetical protein
MKFKKSIKKIKYIISNAATISDHDLTSLDKIIYGQIVVLAKKTGSCKAHNDYFAALNHKSLSTIKRSLARLVKYSYIVTVGKNKHRKILDLNHPKNRKICSHGSILIN